MLPATGILTVPPPSSIEIDSAATSFIRVYTVKFEIEYTQSIYLSSVLYEMGRKYVYVVFKGRRTGVFNSWPECHEHVDGFPRESYQKFNSTDEAYKAISSRFGHSSHSWLESSVNVEEKESSVNVEEKVSEKSQSTSVMLFSFLFVFIFGVIVGKIV
ncbi:hypothetical protein Dsin_018516 [Dipteronia sinensis]|uniref:Ribonuclease H1 N-terminal domain-containing protein n=1 Tax=Dipteronia sinensis TaxID=43782 RepID=A0AAE0A5Q1_9ROSI|nr:hypothetical protein Dsin_018516 [Dipteronia sinensis]